MKHDLYRRYVLYGLRKCCWLTIYVRTSLKKGMYKLFKKMIPFVITLVTVLLITQTPEVVAESPLYDEAELRTYLSGIFEADRYSDYGFTTDDVEQMSFGAPVEIYHLNPDFAFGESDELLVAEVDEWIVVIYENDNPVNGIKLSKDEDGALETVGFGYPLELAPDVVKLDQNEILLEEFPTGYYYAFNEQNKTIQILEEELKSTQQLNGVSIDVFQAILEERYEESRTGGSLVCDGSEQEMSHSAWLYSSIGLGFVLGSSIFIIRRKRRVL